MRALAEQLNHQVSAQAISKYEAGKMLPSSSVLVALAKALNVSLDFLMSNQIETIDELEFRQHAGSSARDRARAEAILVDNLERYLAVERILDLHSDTEWAETHRCDTVANESEIDFKADLLRKDWELGIGPIPSICELIEDKGIKVVECDLPEGINGLACHVLKGGKPAAKAVVVSSRVNVERKRFTLAHELAHHIIRSTSNPKIELEAARNRFAGAFLMPSKRLLADVGGHRNRITYYEIVRLKHAYGVSAAALLVRLGQLGILRAAAVRRAFLTYARSWRTDEPSPIKDDSNCAGHEKPRRFERLVFHAVGEEMISLFRAAELLAKPLDYVEWQINGPLHQ